MSAVSKTLELRAVTNFLANLEQQAMSLAGTHSVHRLEQKFRSLIGLPHALAVANATLGLWAVLQALDITGAEIVTTPYTWAGSIGAIIHTGNRPVFADIRPDTLVVDSSQVAARITP